MSTSETLLIGAQETFEKVNNLPPDERASISFIFGAGASRGYTSHDSMFSMPPVVRELFNDSDYLISTVLNRHEDVLRQKDHIESKIAKNDNDLEKYLSKLYNQNDDIDLFADLLMYFQDLFHSVSEEIDKSSQSNHYMRLVYAMTELRGKKNPWTCISFNYDTIFEKSLQATGWFKSRSFNNMTHYNKDVGPRFLKMHGGVNFRFIYREETDQVRSLREIFDLMMKRREVEGSAVSLSDLNKGIPKFHTLTSEVNRAGNMYTAIQNYNFPLMMIPIHAKAKSENPVFDQMLIEAQEEIRSSSIVVSIGYNFGDEFFCEKIKDIDTSQKELIMVGSDSLLTELRQSTAYKNVSRVWKGKIRIFDGTGFGAFVDAI